MQFDPGVFLLGVALFLTLTLAGMLAYMAWCVATMRYTLDNDHLSIRYGGVRHYIPVESITAVHGPGPMSGSKPVTIRRRRTTGMVPGHMIGHAESAELGRVMEVATVPPAGQVFVVTQGVTFALSPQDSLGFVSQLNRVRGSLIADDIPPWTELSGPSRWAAGFWADRLIRYLLLAGLALCALLFGYLSLVYADLPTRLALHWNSQAQVDRIGDPTELLRL
ncbi:MAG: PH domain-containing protein, partial [Chloroflexota bacterium]|nr:PH domain-containing protein [Chloroflexota bacterium]